jgi:hypothetical protein
VGTCPRPTSKHISQDPFNTRDIKKLNMKSEPTISGWASIGDSRLAGIYAEAKTDNREKRGPEKKGRNYQHLQSSRKIMTGSYRKRLYVNIDLWINMRLIIIIRVTCTVLILSLSFSTSTLSSLTLCRCPFGLFG